MAAKWLKGPKSAILNDLNRRQCLNNMLSIYRLCMIGLLLLCVYVGICMYVCV